MKISINKSKSKMKLSKLKTKSLSVKKLLNLLVLLITLSGCAKPAAKTVLVDYFCGGKYTPLWLNENDIEVLTGLRQNPKYQTTVDKYIDYHAINEKEFKQCPTLAKPQKQD